MLRTAVLCLALAASASAFSAGPMMTKPMGLRASAFTPAARMARPAAAKASNKAVVRMGLESITDTDGGFGDIIKWFVFFGASFVPSFFLAAYFLGGYYPGLAVGATQEPSWWPTALQYSHGVPKGVLNENVAVVEAKEKAAAEAQAKAEAAKKAAKKAARLAKEAAAKAAAGQ